MLGCKPLDCLVKKPLLGEVDSYFFNGLHFVVGLSFTHQQRKAIHENVKELLRSVRPSLELGHQIQLRYLSVKPSQFNRGFGVN